MLHGTIRNDDFWRNTALQYWNNVANIRKQCRKNDATLCCAKNLALRFPAKITSSCNWVAIPVD